MYAVLCIQPTEQFAPSILQEARAGFDTMQARRLCHLDLLGAPAGVGLPHVGGGLDGRDELEGRVGDADEADDGAADDLPHRAGVEDDDADEDVDCSSPSVHRI